MMFDPTRWLQSQETWQGSILHERRSGSTGFGYDPLVWLEDYGCSVAEISQHQKDMVSHRAKAVRALVRAAGW
jgi:XTP/dITP diphosphohydrolase